MTGPQDSEAGTRPISVAELLAKNGTIGAAPPGGGRRRRRRGNADAVTVAELTGEIPIIRTGELPVAVETDQAETDQVEPDKDDADKDDADKDDAAAPSDTDESGSSAEDAEPAPEPLTDSSDPAPEDRSVRRPELSDVPVARRGPALKPERSHFPMVARKTDHRGAELMSPDPILEESADADAATLDDTELDDIELADSELADSELADSDGQPDQLGIGSGEASHLQTYLRATSGPLFGGQTVADDAARRGVEDGDLLIGDDLEVAEALEDSDDADVDDDGRSSTADDLTEDAPTRGQLVVRGLAIAAQSIVAVAFGAGLFIAFDQLWKWNSIVALVLGVLVILGLVVGVRIVRKTEDIGSTLTAVAVGALVAFGPLALWQAS